ncbi:hypothetical protein EYF80_065147 [Liparis tanakae]|uniref:Uncharacterized protein n=1 Tax=Liparis tanakae TaxID=230148 RepID=A0A4Z2E7E0_9TELE|nr:hypothetical protein EYF80_065147 [Liparis tanakae]
METLCRRVMSLEEEVKHGGQPGADGVSLTLRFSAAPLEQGPQTRPLSGGIHCKLPEGSGPAWREVLMFSSHRPRCSYLMTESISPR